VGDPTGDAPAPVVRLRLFARAREVAGTASAEVAGATVGEVLAAATARFGPAFAEVLACSRVWVDGDEPADGPATPVPAGAEVAVLPPVSGGDGS
jgi:molybdopterin converting factor small subunit